MVSGDSVFFNTLDNGNSTLRGWWEKTRGAAHRSIDIRTNFYESSKQGLRTDDNQVYI